MADAPRSETDRAEILKILDDLRDQIERLAALNHPADGPYIDNLRDLEFHFRDSLTKQPPDHA
jgi:hypothetical protein